MKKIRGRFAGCVGILLLSMAMLAFPSFADSEDIGFSESFFYTEADIIPESFDTEEEEDVLAPSIYMDWYDGDDTAVNASYTYGGSYSYNALSSAEKVIYNDLLNGARAIDTSGSYSAALDENNGYYYFDKVNLSSVVDSDTLMKCFVAVRYDHPEFFWMGHRLRYNSSTGNLSCKYAKFTAGSSDYAEGSARMTVKTEIFNEVEKVLSSSDYYRNDYSKEIYIITYLAQKNVYASSAEHAHDISGLFIDGRSVCEAYAKCFQLLCNALGIRSNYVVGKGGSTGTLSDHGWDQICLDGQWYNVDPTWADGGSTLKTQWINLKDTDVVSGRTWLESHVCRSTGASGADWHHGVFSCTADKFSYENHNDNYVYSSSDPAVRLADKPVYYSSLNEAVASAASGSTLVLLKDQTLSSSVTADITLDGAGKKLTFSGSISVSASFTVRNASLSSAAGAKLTLSDEGKFTAAIGCTGNIAALSGGSVVIRDNMSFGTLSELISLTIADRSTLTVTSNEKVNAVNAGISDGSKLIGGSAYIFSKLGLGGEEAAVLSPSGASAYVRTDSVTGKGRIYFDGEDCCLETEKEADTENIVFVIDEEEYPIKNTGTEKFIYKADADYILSVAVGEEQRQFISAKRAAAYISSLPAESECTVSYLKTDSTWQLGTEIISVKQHRIILQYDGDISCANGTLDSDVTIKAASAAFTGTLSSSAGTLRADCPVSFEAVSGKLSFICTKDSAVTGKGAFSSLGLENGAKLTVSGSLSAASLTVADGSIETQKKAALSFGSINASEKCLIDISSGGSLAVSGTVTLADNVPVLVKPTELAAGAVVASAEKAGAESFRIDSEKYTLYKEKNVIKMGNAVFVLSGSDGSTIGSYFTWQDVLQAIKGSSDSSFEAALTDDCTVSKLTLPGVKLVINGNSHTLTAENTTSVTVSSDITLTDLDLSFTKKAAIKLGGRLTLEKCTFANLSTIKGTAAGTGLSCENTDLDAVINVYEVSLTDCVIGSNITVKNALTPSGAFVKGTIKTGSLTGEGSLSVLSGKLITLTTDNTSPETSIKLTVKNSDGTPAELAGQQIQTATVKKVYGGYFTPDEQNGEGLKFVQSGKKVFLCASDALITAKSDNSAFSADYLTLADAMSAIKLRAAANETYTVTLSSDIALTGAFPLPSKGKYAGMLIDAQKPVKIISNGSISLTAPLTIGENVTVENTKGLTVKAGAYSFTAKGSIPYLGAVSASATGKIILEKPALAMAAVKASSIVCSELEFAGTAALTTDNIEGTFIYPSSLASRIKLNGGGDITLRLTDGLNSGKIKIATVKANSFTGKVTFADSDDYTAIPSGKVLYAVSGAQFVDVVYSGQKQSFIDITDAAKFITSRKAASESYTIDLNGDQSVAGKLPMPASGTYSSLTIDASVPSVIEAGGALTLTGALNIKENVTIKCASLKAGSSKFNAEGTVYVSGAVKGSDISCGELILGERSSANIAVFNGTVAYPTAIAAKIKLTSGGNIVIRLTDITSAALLSSGTQLAVTVKNGFTGSITLKDAFGNTLEGASAAVSGKKIIAKV